MAHPRYPALYQVNTRVWLHQLEVQIGRLATLDDFPDEELDRVAYLGFDWVWLLGVWQTGPVGREISRTKPELQPGYRAALPDLAEDDICGSCFALTGYRVHTALGGDEALARLRARLRKRGLRLMLDFVPNHTARDHPWVKEHPEYYVAGTELDLARQPHNYVPVATASGTHILAHGRDPFFPGWTDTLQLNYGNPATQEAMAGELLRVVDRCDGVRCDMAMLVLPEVFERTWGRPAQPFWPMAIERVRRQHPSFLLMAEVYWDLEWTLQQQGFDYAYDKRLYDRLREGHARPVREHLYAGLDYQDRLARFLENHDEPRAAATFGPGVHQAAAVITFFTPGLRFFHQGQLYGHKVWIPVHLCRGPVEPDDGDLAAFYRRLLAALRHPALRDGRWQLVECVPAWEGNWTWDSFVAFVWQGPAGERLLGAVNYAPHHSQCYVRLPFPELDHQTILLDDRLGPARYLRDGNELSARGLYLDLPPWGCHLLELSAA